MRAAPAIGVALDGTREADAQPWRALVEHGQVSLGCDWPAGPTALRGAVCAAMGGELAHVDLHGHGPDGARQARATVCYRVEGRRPIVWAFGPRAHHHLAQLARISQLDDPTGRPVPVETVELGLGSTEVGIAKDGWRRYEVRQYFPSSVAYARRPRGKASPEQDAWAGQALASSIRMWLADVGIEAQPHRPVHVHLVDVRHERVAWRGRDEAVRWGFSARFVSNAILPDGVGVGQHVAEGFGEIRCAS